MRSKSVILFGDDIVEEFSKLAYHDVRVKTETYPIRYLAEMYEKGELIIPFFQRGYVWSRKTAINLIMTLLKGLDIGDIHIYSVGRKKYVIDGQQRLITLLYFAGYKDILDDDVREMVEKAVGPTRITAEFVIESFKSDGVEVNEAKIRELFSVRNIEGFRQWLASRPVNVKVTEYLGNNVEFGNKFIINYFVAVNSGSRKLSEFDIIRAIHSSDEGAVSYLMKIDEIVEKTFKVKENGLKYSTITAIEKAIIITDYLLNGFYTDRRVPSAKNKVADVVNAIITDRAEAIRFGMSDRVFEGLEEIEEAIMTLYERMTHNSKRVAFRKPQIHSKFATITFNRKKLSPLFISYETFAIVEAKRRDQNELLTERWGEFVHELILNALRELDDADSTSLADFIEAKRVASSVISYLSSSKSVTYYHRSPGEVKDLLWGLYTKKGKLPVCPYCHAEIVSKDDAELGHIRAFNKTRTSSILNLVLEHRKCNREHKDKDLKIKL